MVEEEVEFARHLECDLIGVDKSHYDRHELRITSYGLRQDIRYMYKGQASLMHYALVSLRVLLLSLEQKDKLERSS